MSTTTCLPLMTVDEFFELPEPEGDFTYELHFGELVEVSRPRKRHYSLQLLIQELLASVIDLEQWMVGIEMPYGLTKDYDARAADIGVVSKERWDAVPDEGFLIGAPELVIEVKSRSNRDKKVEKNALDCITHGAEAVWYVKPGQGQIYVYDSTAVKVYTRGALIPLPPSMGAHIETDRLHF